MTQVLSTGQRRDRVRSLQAQFVRYRFDHFTVDEDTRQLLSPEGERHLSPKAFELLTLLIANRSRALSKAELQEQLWPSTFVLETNLAGLITDIRQALDDSAQRPRFVRTIHRFGYRFVGDVVGESAPTASHPPGVVRYLRYEQRRLHLAGGANVIGRAPDATIHIDSPGLSRWHARVVVDDSHATLEDLGSKNGTHVNGTRIDGPIRLADGDEIRFGAIVVTFHVVNPGAPTETVAPLPSKA